MRHLVYLLLACPGLLSAQQDYHRYFNVEEEDRMNDLIVLSDSLIVGIGTSTPESGPERAFLLTLNTDGEILRSNGIDYPLRTRGMTLARQSDSTYWAGCWRTPEGIIDDWLIYRVNALTGAATGFGWGDPESDEQIRTMTATADGGVVVAGNTGDFNEAIIARLDADGNERFRKGFSIPGNTYTIITDLKLAVDGDILAAGIYDPTGGPSSPKGYFLLRLSVNAAHRRQRLPLVYRRHPLRHYHRQPRNLRPHGDQCLWSGLRYRHCPRSSQRSTPRRLCPGNRLPGR